MLEVKNPALPAHAFVELAPPRRLISIAAFKNTLAPLQEALGVTLPATPIRIAANSTDYLWAGPNAWFVMSADTVLATRIAAATNNLAAVTDQSDGRVILRVFGPHARAVLTKLVPIDLHPAAFAPDATALTLAGHITVQVWQADDGAFELACFRSFAAALHHALAQAIDACISF